jgi:hypothetical protein
MKLSFLTGLLAKLHTFIPMILPFSWIDHLFFPPDDPTSEKVEVLPKVCLGLLPPHFWVKAYA